MENPVPPELSRYVGASDSNFYWKQVAANHFEMVSQVWQGASWTHSITLSEGKGELGILVITGGDPNELDLAEQEQWARMAGLPVATLFNIPNQPLFDDLWEDDLIAYTFDQFLETEDETWPLLLPMVKSVVRAMDVLQQATEGRLKRFLVTGLSKRGWTTWLSAAINDPRIAGIAPMVIDNLNVQVQMKHQLDTWGCYSEQIEPYTARDLQEKAQTPKGQRLARLIDPYSYLSEITVPTLIVNGANDPYWQVDALSKYWDDLQQPKWASLVPNAGHLLGDKVQQHEVLGAFARALAGLTSMPQPIWEFMAENGRLRASGSGADEISLWLAHSESLDFRNSEWVELRSYGADDVTVPIKLNTAALLSFRYRVGETGFTLTSPAVVFPSQR